MKQGSVSVGQIYSDAGVTASDSLDGDLTSEIIIGGDTLDTANAGIYVLTLTSLMKQATRHLR